jgi:hypothetical protein
MESWNVGPQIWISDIRAVLSAPYACNLNTFEVSEALSTVCKGKGGGGMATSEEACLPPAKRLRDFGTTFVEKIPFHGKKQKSVTAHFHEL